MIDTEDCAHCGEAEVADNGIYCQPCADKAGEEYMQEFLAGQCTQLLPVVLPVVSGYMQQMFDDALTNRLIELLAQLCADPEAFKVRAKEASDGH